MEIRVKLIFKATHKTILQFVLTALLDDIFREYALDSVAIGVVSVVDGLEVNHIPCIEVIPVDLVHIFVLYPISPIFKIALLGIAVLALIEHVFVIARQVFVVIRTRVRSLAPFE